MLVGPRMSVGSTIGAEGRAHTLAHPDRSRTSEEVRNTHFTTVVLVSDEIQVFGA